MLQQHNIHEFSLGIPWQRLPRTLRDAMILTAKLGFGLLWIDALCIIQDDHLDWSIEAAHMTYRLR